MCLLCFYQGRISKEFCSEENTYQYTYSKPIILQVGMFKIQCEKLFLITLI